VRKVIDNQIKIGEVDISGIEFDLRSRDEIPKLLMGLQAVYCNKEIREKIFILLEEAIPEDISKTTGRPGMELWKILVLGTLRLNCNWDYDKLKEIADNHSRLREMLGHVKWLDITEYPLQTLKDNVKLFTPELLDKINKVVVDYGHSLLKKKAEKLEGRCDSFVVENNVHYPTDTNLLYDAVRKSVELITTVYNDFNLNNWRQSKSLLQKLKNTLRKFQKMRHSNSKDEKKKQKRADEIKDICKSFMAKSRHLLDRVLSDMASLRSDGIGTDSDLEHVFVMITKFTEYADLLLDQIQRRIINGETIPHEEKIFSIFEEYTEWIVKGKAGISQELGLNVCIIEDQFGFILNHRVMRGEVDKSIAVPFTSDTKKTFPILISCSYDKGFWTPENEPALNEILEEVCLPKKGKLSHKDKERESNEKFGKARKKHSAVESGINALENHGLDRCPDHGIEAFDRYISYAVLARNFQILGNIIQKKEMARRKRSERMKRVKRKLAA
jgi:transposase, IS5 family